MILLRTGLRVTHNRAAQCRHEAIELLREIWADAIQSGSEADGDPYAELTWNLGDKARALRAKVPT